MDRINGAGHIGHLFVAEDSAINRPPTEITAEWLNGVQEELIGIIEAAGIVPGAATDQLVKAIIKTGLQGNYFNTAVAGGTADALTATFAVQIEALTNGMSLYIRAGSANATTTPTFTPAIGTIAAKTIVKGNGLPLVVGDIAGAGHWIEVQYDSALDKWVVLNPATGVRASDGGYMLVRDERAQNMAGGSCTAGQTVARTLNTVSANNISGASLAANQVTLPAGTYRIDASAPVHSVDENRLSLYNVTDAAVALLGTSENGITNVVTRSLLKGRITLAATKVFELRQYTGTSIATNGFGLPVNSGGVEVYSQLEIIKEA